MITFEPCKHGKHGALCEECRCAPLQSGLMGNIVEKEDGVYLEPSDWRTELEKLALTEPDPNQALYNLPQLKGFISKLLKDRDQEIMGWIERDRAKQFEPSTILDNVYLTLKFPLK